MSLDSDILTDLLQLLAEHGFVDSPELSLRMPKLAFPQALPKSGERILVEEKPYRIV